MRLYDGLKILKNKRVEYSLRSHSSARPQSSRRDLLARTRLINKRIHSQLQPTSWAVGPEFAGAPQGANSHAPPAAPVEMASQSAAKIAAPQAAVGLGMLVKKRGAQEDKKVRPAHGEEVVRRSSRNKQDQLTKYRFVRGAEGGASRAAVSASREEASSAEVVPPSSYSSSSSSHRQTRTKIIDNSNSRSRESKRVGSAAEASGGAAAGSPPHFLRSRYKLVRRQSDPKPHHGASTD